MKRFHFRLDRVRQWRSEQAAMEQGRLAGMIAERQAFVAGIAALQTERAGIDGALVRRTEVEARELAAVASAREWIKFETVRLTAKIAETEAHIVAQRERVTVAQRNFKLLERLKERALEHWKQEESLELENLASEVFLAKWRPG